MIARAQPYPELQYDITLRKVYWFKGEKNSHIRMKIIIILLGTHVSELEHRSREIPQVYPMM